MSSASYQNHLIDEKSPYLLQHAHNPVYWYAWKDEAFVKAKAENKPVLLSIGYSTCHWCHVMAHESFENEQVAKVMNQYFINIKVDREERPDIDHIYMTAVSAMTGQGGWPLTVFLTPDRRPFYGGTYFPPYAKWGSPGFIDVLMSVQQTWANDSNKLISSSLQLTGLISAHLPQGNKSAKITPTIMEQSYGEFAQTYDPEYGGFGGAPKFPTSHNLSFLLRYAKRYQNDHAINMVTHTLYQMANGGIDDHLGGGFHRYSTDAQWQMPHFEKMLYDQALITRTYLEAYQLTQNPFFADIARHSFDYVITQLQDPSGGFYCAEDADSLDEADGEHKEGAFYLWRHDEILALLTAEEAEIFNYRYEIGINGNALSDPQGEFVNKNVIWAVHTIEETAEKFKQSLQQIITHIDSAKAKLLKVRPTRPKPHLDDKILVDWNGLMISSMAFGSAVLQDDRYLATASKAADFILNEMIDLNRLHHRYRHGERAILGSIDDYAFITEGLITLFEVGGQVKYLTAAITLAEQMIDLFWDETNGGFYFSGKDDEEMILRPKQIYDGAIPSGNSVAVSVLTRLFHLTLHDKWLIKARQIVDSFADEIAKRPSAYSQMMIGYDLLLGPVKEVVVALPSANSSRAMTHELWSHFYPNKIVINRPIDSNELKKLVEMAPFMAEQKPLNNQMTVYVCQDHRCQLPVHEAAELKKLLTDV